MPDSDPAGRTPAVRFKDVYGVFILNPDEVQFRTGSLSGPACVLSDPERRGLLGPVIDRLLSWPAAPLRPWNESELDLLDEILPELQRNGIVEHDQPTPAPLAASAAPLARTPLAQARIAVLGHGMLGHAVQGLLADAPCGPITVIESASVAPRDGAPQPPAPPLAPRCRPRDGDEWAQALAGHDWVIAAQDCFEPEELAALADAAWRLAVPWSLVCLDGYEGWIGPTFIAGQTACFECFRRRLFAGAAEPKHIFMDPAVQVRRAPAPGSAGPETRAWISLIASIFALDFIGAAEGRGFTLDNLVVVHRLNLTFQRESVLRLPRCPHCSPRGGRPAVNVFAHLLGAGRDGR